MLRQLTISLLLCSLLIACTEDQLPEGMVMMQMPVRLYMPVEQGVQTRAMGDPGTTETFSLPEYAYIYIVSAYAERPEVINQTGEIHLNPELWTKTVIQSGINPGDSVFYYNGYIDVVMPATRETGRIYAVLSRYSLGSDFAAKIPTTEEQVKNLTFDVTAEMIEQNGLRDLYSSPYNLLTDNAGNQSAGGHYYGTIRNYASAHPSLSLMLYHVAAKVDLMWNVDPSIQATTHLSDMQFVNLKVKDCYLFRPMENTSLGSDTYTAMPSGIINTGNQWYGRYSFYAIPYHTGSDIYPFTIKLWYNGSTRGAEPTKTVSVETVSVTGVDTFTPWVRGFLNIRNAE